MSSTNSKSFENITKHRRKFKRHSYMSTIKHKRKQLSNEFTNLFNDIKSETPTTLIELSTKEWKRLQHNSILIGDIFVSSDENNGRRYDKIYYKNISFGKYIESDSVNNISEYNFNLPKKKGGNQSIKKINISNIKNRMILITTEKRDIQRVNNGTIFISTSNTSFEDTANYLKPSGIIILFMMTLSQPQINSSKLWTNNLYDELKKCKPNIIKNNAEDDIEGINKLKDHFGSRGFIASFGNRGAYSMTTDVSSVGQYTNIKSKSVATTSKIDMAASKFENDCANELEKAILSLKRIIANISNLICPILKAGFDLQTEQGQINFKKVFTSDLGLWQSSICVNAITKEFHTEKDVTYTLITVPSQERLLSKHNGRETYFLFEINSDNCLGFEMKSGISFLFSGTMLTHKQFSIDGYMDYKDREKIDPYYNIASYGNEKLFRHMRISFSRSNLDK